MPFVSFPTVRIPSSHTVFLLPQCLDLGNVRGQTRRSYLRIRELVNGGPLEIGEIYRTDPTTNARIDDRKVTGESLDKDLMELLQIPWRY